MGKELDETEIKIEKLELKLNVRLSNLEGRSVI